MDRLIIERVRWGGYHSATAWDGMEILRDFLESVEEELLKRREAGEDYTTDHGSAIWCIRNALCIVSSIINDAEHQTDAGEADRDSARQLVAAVRLLLANTPDTTA